MITNNKDQKVRGKSKSYSLTKAKVGFLERYIIEFSPNRPFLTSSRLKKMSLIARMFCRSIPELVVGKICSEVFNPWKINYRDVKERGRPPNSVRLSSTLLLAQSSPFLFHTIEPIISYYLEKE